MVLTRCRNWKDPEFWDEKARFYFPFSFFVFNLAYWLMVGWRRWHDGIQDGG